MKRTLHAGSPPPTRYNLRTNNNAEEEIPAFGVIKVVDASQPDEDGNYDVDKPDGESGTYWLNCPVKTLAGKHGAATNRFPSVAAYDEEDGTPAAGEEWGPGNDTWLLKKSGSGFRILGGAADGRVRVEKIGDGGSFTRRRARVTVNIPAATDNLVANWGTGGKVKLLDPTTGAQDTTDINVINPNQDPYSVDYFVMLDTSFTPPQVKYGSCVVWVWA